MNHVSPVMPEVNFGVDPVEDLYERMAQLHAEGRRVVPVRYIDDVYWLILPHGVLGEAFQDEANLPSRAAYERHSMPSMGRTMQAMAGNEHRINRALASGPFQPAAIRKSVEGLLVPVANQLIDALVGTKGTDLVDSYTCRYPFRIISGMLGVPIEDERAVQDWVWGVLRFPWEPERALKAKADLDAYLQPILDDRRANPGDDIISRLATSEVEGRRLTDEEIRSFIRLLYPAGAETTYLLMGSMMLEVLRDPALKQRLLDNPQDRNVAVEEALRKHGSTSLLPRYTEKEVTIAGVTIPANSWLLYGIVPANHDPAEFPDPLKFSLDRGPIRHLAFGKGPHFCLGSHLAREELRVSLSLLLERLPGLRIAEGATPKITGAVLRGVLKLPVEYDAVLPPATYEAEKRSNLNASLGATG